MFYPLTDRYFMLSLPGNKRCARRSESRKEEKGNCSRNSRCLSRAWLKPGEEKERSERRPRSPVGFSHRAPESCCSIATL